MTFRKIVITHIPDGVQAMSLTTHCKCEMVKDWRIVAEVLIFQLVDFDYFVVKNEYSLVTFNNPISHLQRTIKNSKIWLKFSSWNFNVSIGQFWLFLAKNDYLSSEKWTRRIVRVWKMTYFRLKDQINIGTI